VSKERAAYHDFPDWNQRAATSQRLECCGNLYKKNATEISPNTVSGSVYLYKESTIATIPLLKLSQSLFYLQRLAARGTSQQAAHLQQKFQLYLHPGPSK